MFLFLLFFLSSSDCFQACSMHLCLTRSDSTIWCHIEECGRGVLPRLPPVPYLVVWDVVFLDTVNPQYTGIVLGLKVSTSGRLRRVHIPPLVSAHVVILWVLGSSRGGLRTWWGFWGFSPSASRPTSSLSVSLK